MVAKTRRFQDHREVGLVMLSPSPSTRKRIGRGVCNFNTRCWGQGEAKRRDIWNLRQIHAKSSDKKSPFEL